MDNDWPGYGKKGDDASKRPNMSCCVVGGSRNWLEGSLAAAGSQSVDRSTSNIDKTGKALCKETVAVGR